MSRYPDVITDDILNRSKHIPDSDILSDIDITAGEVAIKQREYAAYTILADHDRLAAWMADATLQKIKDREDFIDFLRKLLLVRRSKSEDNESPNAG